MMSFNSENPYPNPFPMNNCKLFFSVFFLCLTVSYSAQINHGGEPLNWSERTTPDNIPSVRMPELDMVSIQAEDEVTDQFTETPYRFGITHGVNLDIMQNGTLTQEEGMDVWRLAIECPDAVSVSFLFDDFNIPVGGELFAYNEDMSEFKGAFNYLSNKESGIFPLGVIKGSTVIFEYRATEGLKPAKLHLSEVTHGYRPILNKWEEERGPFGNSGNCNINVNCPQGAPWQDEKRGVALITQGGFALCSGSLVNNTAEDGTPYFLTANHCLGNPGNWTYYFNHESSSCLGSTGPTNQSISGGTLRASASSSDFALIELSATPPASYNVFYNGWNATDIQNVSSAVSIHHPSGDVKKICFENNAPFHETLSFNGNSNTRMWYINQWEEGVTEPGSSGSPLFDPNGRVIGMLSGGAAACSGNQNNGLYDFYGRFGVAWDLGGNTSSRLNDWLDPTNSGTELLDGYDPAGGGGATCDDGVQNGQETGVDCGGPSCPPCPCNDESYTLSIQLDDYPEETSWNVTQDGSTIASGGTYPNQPDGSTVTESICLADGCYTLTIFDSFGDGLCCQYGNGSYSFTDSQGAVVASGASFGTSEATDFCVGGTTACQSPNNLDVVEIDFGGSNPRVNATWNNPEGTTSCEVRGGRISNGSAGTANPVFGNINNTQIITATNGSTLNFNIALVNNPNIPFQVGATYGYEVRCSCGDGSGFSPWSGIFPSSTFVVPSAPALPVESGSRLPDLYPNPVSDELNFHWSASTDGILDITVYDLSGRSVFVAQRNILSGQQLLRMNFSELAPGTYLLHLGDKNGEAQSIFMKR